MVWISLNRQKYKMKEVYQGDKEEYKSSTLAKLTNLFKYNGLIT